MHVVSHTHTYTNANKQTAKLSFWPTSRSEIECEYCYYCCCFFSFRKARIINKEKVFGDKFSQNSNFCSIKRGKVLWEVENKFYVFRMSLFGTILPIKELGDRNYVSDGSF